jgi:hypothetical protein
MSHRGCAVECQVVTGCLCTATSCHTVCYVWALDTESMLYRATRSVMKEQNGVLCILACGLWWQDMPGL